MLFTFTALAFLVLASGYSKGHLHNVRDLLLILSLASFFFLLGVVGFFKK